MTTSGPSEEERDLGSPQKSETQEEANGAKVERLAAVVRADLNKSPTSRRADPIIRRRIGANLTELAAVVGSQNTAADLCGMNGRTAVNYIRFANKHQDEPQAEASDNAGEQSVNTPPGQQTGPIDESQSAPRIGPPLQEMKRGDYVTYGQFGRVMVIDRIGEDVVVLEDPFHPKGEYPIEVTLDTLANEVMMAAEGHVRNEYARLGKPLPPYFGKSDAERMQGIVMEDRKYLIDQIKEGITSLIAAKRTTAVIRKKLGKSFSELADTYGGELKKACDEFKKQHDPSQMLSYTTIQSWVKFYRDFKNTPDDKLPITRDEARKANPAWRCKKNDGSDSPAAESEIPPPKEAANAVAKEHVEMDEGQAARDAKRKLAKQQQNGAYRCNVVKLAADKRPLATEPKNRATAERTAELEDDYDLEKEDRLTTAFTESASALMECCGTPHLIHCVAELLTNEEIEEAIHQLDSLIHPAATEKELVS